MSQMKSHLPVTPKWFPIVRFIDIVMIWCSGLLVDLYRMWTFLSPFKHIPFFLGMRSFTTVKNKEGQHGRSVYLRASPPWVRQLTLMGSTFKEVTGTQGRRR